VPFDFSNRHRIAIIGAGISGLAAAYELSSTHAVTLFEAAPRLGGHARTVFAGLNGDQPVDTGFIVFNHPNYPNLTRMFGELQVPTKQSNMSFSASIGDGAIEYGLNNLAALTAQSRNMVRPQFWRMIADILKFNKNAVDAASDTSLSLGEFLNRMELGEWFRRYYLLPISGAIWSSTPEQMINFPARSLVQFFQNHALLSHKNHQWYTVDGGSIEYVKRMAAAIETRGGSIREHSPVQGVRRRQSGVSIRVKGGEWEEFDRVIFACHSDDALRLLERSTSDEQRILGNLNYQSNRAVLHQDETLMPKRRNCWASWVFISPDDKPKPRIGLTYWMNLLQGIPDNDPLFLSLNPPKSIREEAIYDETEFRHPVFDQAAIQAQQELPAIQGQNLTYYCGAYTRWGFHEDGYASAMNVVEHLRRLDEKVAA
jgi:uncharacterized protein